jgi:hypothetical protein
VGAFAVAQANADQAQAVHRLFDRGCRESSLGFVDFGSGDRSVGEPSAITGGDRTVYVLLLCCSAISAVITTRSF